jgi:hypothetical protein
MVFNVPAPAKYRAQGFYGASGIEASGAGSVVVDLGERSHNRLPLKVHLAIPEGSLLGNFLFAIGSLA